VPAAHIQKALIAIHLITLWKTTNAEPCANKALMLKALLPMAWLAALMGNSKNLWSKVCIFFTHHSVGKAVEVVNPQPTMPMRAGLAFKA